MEAPKEQSKVNLEFVEPDKGLVFTYTNNVQLGATSYDVRLIFGELVSVNGDKAVVEQRVQATMSWLQAKQLMELLKKNIDAYEAKNGVIDVRLLPS